MKKKLLITSLCGILLFTAGCTKIPKMQDGKEVVASIEGKEFATEELYTEMKKQYGATALVNMVDRFITNKEIETDQTAKDYADTQIKYLKQQFGDNFQSALINAGFANEDALRDSIIEDYKKNKVVEKYLKEHLSEEEIKEYYEKEIFGEMTAKHILIKPETKDGATDEEKTAAESAALEKAKNLITQLNEGADFDTLAKENSDDTASAVNGGLISDFTKDEVVEEFWNATAQLEDGKYTTEPVKSTYGYHIILRVSQKEKPAFDDVKEDIKSTLVTNKLQNDSTLAQKTWVEVRKSYNFNIVDTDIKSIYEQTISNIK